MFIGLLKEALEDKPFSTKDELETAIRSVLAKSSTYQPKEKISNGKPIPLDFVYSLVYNTHTEKFKIIFTGDQVVHIHNVMHRLKGKDKDKEIHFIYSHKGSSAIIEIPITLNVTDDSMLTSDTKEEIESGAYGVLGTSVKSKSEQDTVFANDRTKLKIYNELKNKRKKASWYLKSTRLGKIDVTEYIFQLNPSDDI